MAGKPKNYGTEYGYISFAKLRDLCEDRGLKKQYFLDNGIHVATVYKLWRDENVDCYTLTMICNLLGVQPKHIMEYIPQRKE